MLAVSAIFAITAPLLSPATVSRQGVELIRKGSRVELRLEDGGLIKSTSAGVTNLRTMSFGNSTTKVVMWDEFSGRKLTPWYAISLDGEEVNRTVEASNTINLLYRNFDPLQGVPAVADNLRANSSNSLYLVQFVTQPLDEYRQAITAAGGDVLNYIPNNSYIVRMGESTKQLISNFAFIRWIGNYEPAYRTNATIRTALLNGTLNALRYNIMVIEESAAIKSNLGAKIRGIGGNVVINNPEGLLVVADLTPGQLQQVLSMDEVSFVDQWGEPQNDMDIVRSVGGANFIQTTLGFTGQGVTGEVMDGGIRRTHLDFNPRGVTLHNTTNPSNDSHGTATTGIVFGDGGVNAAGKGMLPDGNIIFAAYGQMTNRFTHTAQLLQSPYFACFQSNSWGDPQTTAYTTVSADMDTNLFSNDFVLLNSQSNTGNQTSRPQAWAKNVVSVGGIKHQNTATKTDDNWTNGASIGPAADGRLKPEISYWYENIFCPTSTNDSAYTSSFGGTSAATPMSAGHFGIFFQMWAMGQFGNSALGSTVFANRPRAMTSKAIMINTASQYTFSGTSADLSRYKQGWGLPDLTNLYNARNSMFIINEGVNLTNLQTATYRVYVPAGQPNFRATMSFKEPAGDPATSGPQAKNNLSLKVTTPGGTIYWGNNGLAAGNWSTAGGTGNLVDTVENVLIQNPASGIYTVQIVAESITTDAVTATAGTVDANFALVVGNVQCWFAPASIAPISPNALVTGNLASVGLSDNSRYTVAPNPAADEDLGQGVTFSQTLPVSSLTELKLTVEHSASLDGVVSLQLLNTTNGQWESVGGGGTNATDGLSSVTITSNPSRFVNSVSRVIQGRIIYQPTADVTNPPVFLMDQIRIEIQP